MSSCSLTDSRSDRRDWMRDRDAVIDVTLKQVSSAALNVDIERRTSE